ncbi:MAG TPA: zinc dependent phospholipase C family protein, partial [Candidatus Angelobacter sp.]|nr:zinc dependent phospholipase C family protein [Candidatus Angelobacter sp.]
RLPAVSIGLDFTQVLMEFPGTAAMKLRMRGLTLLLLMFVPQWVAAYSALTHEQVVDLAWTSRIEPLLRQRFPNASDAELTEAHAYAYGGCIIQDLGYYPFGSKDFSNLVHYVRSGDFVSALLRDSSDIDEYAFALGALAHYVSDTEGHPAINRSVAMEYPKLRAKYGERVTYEDNPRAHIRTEFGFDVVQVAKNRYTSDEYHSFIGFQVSKPLLEQAFRETYGLELSDVFGNVDLSIGTYRRSVSTVIPEMTRVALLTKHAELVQDNPTFDEKKFLYRLSRTEYEKEWGSQYQQPGPGARFLAFVIRIVPKVGPLKTVDITVPSSTTENLYIASVNKTVDSYNADLASLLSSKQLNLPNLDFDTGWPTEPGEYELADQTYNKLVNKLSARQFDLLNAQLQSNVATYYAHARRDRPADASAGDWDKLMAEIDALRSVNVESNTRVGKGAGPGGSVR